jgi:hypothetical protein
MFVVVFLLNSSKTLILLYVRLLCLTQNYVLEKDGILHIDRVCRGNRVVVVVMGYEGKEVAEVNRYQI